jgi:hypothetical protein
VRGLACGGNGSYSDVIVSPDSGIACGLECYRGCDPADDADQDRYKEGSCRHDR